MAPDSSLSVAARYSYPGSTRSEFTPRRAAAPCLKRARGLAWVSFSCCACGVRGTAIDKELMRMAARDLKDARVPCDRGANFSRSITFELSTSIQNDLDS